MVGVDTALDRVPVVQELAYQSGGCDGSGHECERDCDYGYGYVCERMDVAELVDSEVDVKMDLDPLLLNPL